MKFIIIGGGGYIGFHIGKALMLLNHSVTLMDIQLPLDEWLRQNHLPNSYLMEGLDHEPISDEKLQCYVTSGDVDSQYEIAMCTSDFKKKFSLIFVKVDILDKQKLRFFFREAGSVDCVIHTASFGMSGYYQLPRFTSMMEKVNIHGLKNVIDLAAKSAVKAFVYTSTYNVVFGGQVIEGGDESLPYFELCKHVDNYSKTKSIAEQILLTADKKCGMRVCALRLAGVMGPMEKRHLPRIVQNIDKGRLVVNYKDEKGAIVDFVGIQNVVQAHVKAALELCTNGDRIGGNAYFISDGKPVNNMEYFRPLVEAKGRKLPRLFIPMWLMFIVVFLLEFVSDLLNIEPLLTRAEFYKTGVTHNFSVEKARKDFNYVPTHENDMNLIVNYYTADREISQKFDKEC